MCTSSFYVVLQLVGFSLLPFSFFLHRKSRRENFSTTLRKKEVVKWKHLGEKLKTRHSSSTYCSITSINTALGAGAEQGQLTMLCACSSDIVYTLPRRLSDCPDSRYAGHDTGNVLCLPKVKSPGDLYIQINS